MAENQPPSSLPFPAIQDKADVLRDLTKKFGLGKELYSEMLKKKDDWKKETISIAVIGPSRIGKSSHINAHIGKKVAQVSSTKQCTSICTSYPHPMNENILLWDVPGVNTLDYNRENYDEKISFNQYDFFLILTDNIFTDDTKWLTDQVQDLGKCYYLVRTKVDYAVNEALDDDDTLTEEDVIADLRQSLEHDLKGLGFDTNKFKVYLVNNKDPSKYDFKDLERDICKDSYSEFQQEALIITIGRHNSSLLQQKYVMFKSRIWKISTASAAGGAMPIPGFSAAVDVGLIIEEVLLYYRGFGLDKASIIAFEDLMNKPRGSIETEFMSVLKSKYPLLYAVRENSPSDLADTRVIKDSLPTLTKNLATTILPQMGLIATSEGVETSVKFFLPILGSFIAGGLSYSVTAFQLRILLNQMLEVAQHVHRIPNDQQSQRLETFAMESLNISDNGTDAVADS